MYTLNYTYCNNIKNIITRNLFHIFLEHGKQIGVTNTAIGKLSLILKYQSNLV